MRVFLAFMVVLAAVVVLRAQGSSGALVVATCGTLPQSFAAGTVRSLTVNTNGLVC